MSVTGGHSCPPAPAPGNPPDTSNPHIHKTRRHLPHWDLGDSTYFITFRLATGELTAHERQLVLQHLRAGSPTYYTLLATVIMPDHAHVILRPQSNIPLSRIMKGIKGVTARLINQHRGTHDRIWQEESWDRIIRNHDELQQKLTYMLENPARKNLTDDGWNWDGWYYDQEALES